MVGDCGTNMAMAARRTPAPIDQVRLDELALAYVSRFATTRAKLKTYLERKLRERGWAGDRDPPVDALVERLAQLGYVDDGAFALAKARSMGARGYGSGRVRKALSDAGISDEDSSEASELAATDAYASALRFARRRSLVPFSSRKPEPRDRQRAIEAMIRAGHGFGLARTIVDLEPGEIPDDITGADR
jgi:regulatory protein